jgi:hypothetical protein
MSTAGHVKVKVRSEFSFEDKKFVAVLTDRRCEVYRQISGLEIYVGEVQNLTQQPLKAAVVQSLGKSDPIGTLCGLLHLR